jgi:hypothetical protein
MDDLAPCLMTGYGWNLFIIYETIFIISSIDQNILLVYLAHLIHEFALLSSKVFKSLL